ncbi:MAG: hypothetical protein ACREO9_01235 [Lysobacterales bacterium]
MVYCGCEGQSREVQTRSGQDRAGRVVKRDETRDISGGTARTYDFSFRRNIDALAPLRPLMPPGMGDLS